MVQENITQSVDYESEATRTRLPYAIKRYASEGKNIPLKKNWLENWCTLPIHFDEIFDEILNLETRDDDVFVVTFMKSGTTWMQECAWLLMNNLDLNKSKQDYVMNRSPFLEYKGIIPTCPSPTELCKPLASPRLLKSHLPANLLPHDIWKKKQKMIYVARNVKDVIVSSYHFLRNMSLWMGNNISEYVEDFLNNEMLYTNFWPHVVDFWQMRHEPFIFFVTYEEMQRDLPAVLQRLCCFLDRPQLTKEQLESIVQHLSFESMKNNKHTNLTHLFKEMLPGVKEDLQFIRRGIVGSFRDELTPDLSARIDKWTAKFLSQYNLTEQDIFGEF